MANNTHRPWKRLDSLHCLLVCMLALIQLSFYIECYWYPGLLFIRFLPPSTYTRVFVPVNLLNIYISLFIIVPNVEIEEIGDLYRIEEGLAHLAQDKDGACTMTATTTYTIACHTVTATTRLSSNTATYTAISTTRRTGDGGWVTETKPVEVVANESEVKKVEKV